jgi:hypothetical protein
MRIVTRVWPHGWFWRLRGRSEYDREMDGVADRDACALARKALTHMGIDPKRISGAAPVGHEGGARRNRPAEPFSRSSTTITISTGQCKRGKPVLMDLGLRNEYYANGKVKICLESEASHTRLYPNDTAWGVSGDMVAGHLGENYSRLASLNTCYDPENVFRLNANIRRIGSEVERQIRRYKCVSSVASSCC